MHPKELEAFMTAEEYIEYLDAITALGAWRAAGFKHLSTPDVRALMCRVGAVWEAVKARVYSNDSGESGYGGS